MIVTIPADETWVHDFAEPRNLIFAAFSPRNESARIEISLNGELQDVVTSSVPHSWWTYAGNPLYRPITNQPGDRLEVYASDDLDFRIDFE